MKRLGNLLLILALAFSLCLSGISAEATTSGLNLTGDWKLFLTDYSYVELSLKQSGTDVTGTYFAHSNNKTYKIPVSGKVSGSKAKLYLTYNTKELVNSSVFLPLSDDVAKKVVGIKSLISVDFGTSEDEATGEYLGWYVEYSSKSVQKYDGGTQKAREKNPPRKVSFKRVFEEAEVMLDGQLLTFDQPAIIKNKSTLVPMRGIFEELGASIEWNAADKTVLAVKGDRQIKLKIGDTNAIINGQKVTLSTPPQIIGGRTLVPLRFVSEALGAKVSWDGSIKTVIITSIEE